MPGWTPMHSGEHNDVGDLTFIDWVGVIIVVAAFIALGVVVWRTVQRRKLE